MVGTNGKNGDRKYIYCLADSGMEKEFTIQPIGNSGGRVYTICHANLSAVVSDAPSGECRVTRDNVLAHQLVMEAVMMQHTILPVRFATIAEGKQEQSAEQRIVEKVLQPRYGEFQELLAKLNGKIALGVKALWQDLNSVFAEIAEEDPVIRRLRSRPVPRHVRVQVGGKVKKALEQKRAKEESEILSVLCPVAQEFRKSEKTHDSMIINATFLLPVARKPEFDRRINQLVNPHQRRMKFRYAGPLPPSDFIEIVVNWEE